MKNFMADHNEFRLLAESLFQNRSTFFKTVAAIGLVLVLIGLGLEVHHLVPLHAP